MPSSTSLLSLRLLNPRDRVAGRRGVQISSRPRRTALQGDRNAAFHGRPDGGRRVVRARARIVDGVKLDHKAVLNVTAWRQSGGMAHQAYQCDSADNGSFQRHPYHKILLGLEICVLYPMRVSPVNVVD